MIEDALNSSAHAPASPRGVARKDSAQQKPLLVPGTTREKVRERILAGLQKNSHLSASQHDLAQIAAECEDTCYSNSKSKYALSPSDLHPSRQGHQGCCPSSLLLPAAHLLTLMYVLGDPVVSSLQTAHPASARPHSGRTAFTAVSCMRKRLCMLRWTV